MKILTSLCLIALAFGSSFLLGQGKEDRKTAQLGHMVFFDLKEETAQAREKLVAACLKDLSSHEGTVYFSVGTLASELRRDVNDTEFDVALHLVFQNKAAHDKYQDHPRHLKFIQENKDLWKKVRVFDSYLSPPAGK